MRTLVWRRLDEPGIEVAHVRSLSDTTRGPFDPGSSRHCNASL
jgi:hypothetical protein